MSPEPLDASAAFAMGNVLALLRLESHGLKLPPKQKHYGQRHVT